MTMTLAQRIEGAAPKAMPRDSDILTFSDGTTIINDKPKRLKNGTDRQHSR